MGDPGEYFLYYWSEAKQLDLSYSQKESWDKLRVSGQGLIEKFCIEELPRLSAIAAVERSFELGIAGLHLPFMGMIDLVATLDRKRTVVDFKTSGSAYGNHEAILSDQLTAYKLAEPDAEQAVLCVLVKTKEPKIEWHPTGRSPEQLVQYLVHAHDFTLQHDLQRFLRIGSISHRQSSLGGMRTAAR